MGNYTRQTLKEKIAKLTIDQLALEREKSEAAMDNLKQGFARDELA